MEANSPKHQRLAQSRFCSPTLMFPWQPCLSNSWRRAVAALVVASNTVSGLDPAAAFCSASPCALIITTGIVIVIEASELVIPCSACRGSL